MKGLLYKEFVIQRKPFLLNMMYCMMIGVIGVAMRLSMNVGNLNAANSGETYALLMKHLWLLRYIPPLCLAFASIQNSVSVDLKSGWLRFCRTTAVDRRKQVAAKMIPPALKAVFGLLMGICHLSLLSLVSGDELTLSMIGNILVIELFVLGFAFVQVTLLLVLKSQQKYDMVIAGFLVVVMVVGSSLMLGKLTELEAVMGEDFDMLQYFRTDLMPIRGYLLPAAAIFCIVMAVAGYLLSCKWIERGED